MNTHRLPDLVAHAAVSVGHDGMELSTRAPVGSRLHPPAVLFSRSRAPARV